MTGRDVINLFRSPHTSADFLPCAFSELSYLVLSVVLQEQSQGGLPQTQASFTFTFFMISLCFLLKYFPILPPFFTRKISIYKQYQTHVIDFICNKACCVRHFETRNYIALGSASDNICTNRHNWFLQWKCYIKSAILYLANDFYIGPIIFGATSLCETFLFVWQRYFFLCRIISQKTILSR